MFLHSSIIFSVYSFFLLLLCPFFLPIVNEAERVNNGKTVAEDPPPAKKIRKCHRVKKEPVAEGKADNDRTEDKQGQPPTYTKENVDQQEGPWGG